MRVRLTPAAFALAAAFASLTADAQSTPSETAPGAATPEPALKPAPQLTPPPISSQRAPPASATSPRAGAPFQEGTIFLRAEKVDGVAEKFVEASGKVELRTRTETVLADWLRYDFVNDEVWGKGDVLVL